MLELGRRIFCNCHTGVGRVYVQVSAKAAFHGAAPRPSPRLDIEDRIADKADDRLQRLRKVMAETDKKATVSVGFTNEDWHLHASSTGRNDFTGTSY